MSYKLIISIVPHNCGEIVTQAAKNSGAGGGSVIMGRGTAENGILQLLGLGDSSKDLAYIIVEDSLKETVISEIIKQTSDKKAHFGVLFTIDVSNFIKLGTKQQNQPINNTIGEKKMENSNYEMINVIVNKGYAEDAMAIARKAGAGGGTIIGARGTARENDAAFFGVQIVPEKEMLIMLVPTEKKDSIIQAIKELPCFAQAGSGIIFCSQAQDFTLLGKK